MRHRAEPGRPRFLGMSLPTVIMMVALMMTLAFTVCAIAFNHLNLSFRSTNNAKAEHLAEAVLALAIEKAQKDIEKYGVDGTADQKTIRLTLPSLPAGSEGILTFDKVTATNLGLPFSTNNRSESSVEGSNPKHSVPGQSLHLVARAEVSGARSTMETIVELPKFPYSIASGGAIKSDGGLLVASVRPGVVYDLSAPLHEDDLQPGHLVSNSNLKDEAIVLEGTNKIMGDVRSASGATIGKDTKVFGEMRLNAEKVVLPDLQARSYDPRNTTARPRPGPEPTAGEIQMVNSPNVGSLSVKGYNVREGGLTVDNGIELNGGVLYVEGNLNVTGGVSGKGAIIATGSITINGGGEATSDNQAALVADGDITLLGTPTNKAKFGGLIYTKGNLKSENMRLAGVFVAGGENGAVSLKDTELYQVDELAKVELGRFEIPSVNPPNTSVGGYSIPASYDLTALNTNLESYKNPVTGGSAPEYLFKFKQGNDYKTFEKGPTGNLALVSTTGPDNFLLDGSDLGLKIFGQSVYSEADAINVTVEGMERLYAADGKTLTAGELANVQNQAKILFASLNAGANISRESVMQSVAVTGTDGQTRPFSWTMDLSEIVNTAERMRVIYWARYR